VEFPTLSSAVAPASVPVFFRGQADWFAIKTILPVRKDRKRTVTALTLNQQKEPARRPVLRLSGSCPGITVRSGD
jgi:hypothetical protein